MKKYKEIISYIFWGGITTVVNWIVYAVCVEVLFVPPTVSNVIAWVAAVTVAYITNKLFVFENKSWQNAGKEIIMFLSARLFSGVIELVGMPIMLSVLNWGTFLGVYGFGEKLVLSIIVIVLNYFFSKYFIFKK
ncbi:MAG: GtrA family protein [Clostridia bacterium]|nr:GtrA family protein [Clostridia bacterium]